MSLKPNLHNEYIESGDIRCILDLLSKYTYDIDEINQIINFYEEYDDLPEIEHICVLLQLYPNCTISDKTSKMIKQQWSHATDLIDKLK